MVTPMSLPLASRSAAPAAARASDLNGSFVVGLTSLAEWGEYGAWVVASRKLHLLLGSFWCDFSCSHVLSCADGVRDEWLVSRRSTCKQVDYSGKEYDDLLDTSLREMSR